MEKNAGVAKRWKKRGEEEKRCKRTGKGKRKDGKVSERTR